MEIRDPSELEGIERPELVIGIVAAVGTPLDRITRVVKEEFVNRRYEVKHIHLSEFMDGLSLSAPIPPPDASDYDRINGLMDCGNELRQTTGRGEALALLAAAHISELRATDEPKHLEGHAFLIRQLKHPDEVMWLRYIYGSAFHLVGVHCPEDTRFVHLTEKMTEEQAQHLINRDQEEQMDWGQQLRRTFYLSDVFVSYPRNDPAGVQQATSECKRFARLLFGEGVITPTRDEYGMFLAFAASLRSADLSRQVGAAILAQSGEVMSVGCNEVPAAGGGQYWEDSKNDERDYLLKYDSNTKITRKALAEALSRLDPNRKNISNDEAMLLSMENRLRETRLMNLTEFGRAVHGEMEAILAAGRLGISLHGHHLYTTTFPCHNCAKHIVCAGLSRVVYIEPYPKSLALELHGDAISFGEEDDLGGRTRFEPFVGVSPRMYSVLFSMQTPEGKRLRRKDDHGDLMVEPWGIRSGASPLSYIERETLAALEAMRIGATTTEED